MSQTSWDPALSSLAGRQFLQRRLWVYSATMATLYLVVGALAVTFFALSDQRRPTHYAAAVICTGLGAIILVGIGMIARGSSVRSARALHTMDAGVLLALGTVAGVVAYITSDRQLNGYLTITMYSFIVVGRALFLPSTRRRTFYVSTLGVLPVLGAYAVIASLETNVLTVHPAGFITGAALIALVAVLMASLGSGVIYGLRAEVDEALQLGQYTLGEKLGEGGMGVVYKASHRMLRRPTAIKLLRGETTSQITLQRFEREVQLTSQLSHPNTIAIFDYGRSPDGTFYYVMEYLSGIDLDKLVRLHGPLPAARVVHLLKQVCGALNEAHNRDLIHRDIKPANIILCVRGDIPDVVKVVDFGLVKKLDQSGGVTAHTVVAGTPGYLSPEAITSPDDVRPTSDLYALGAVAYFLLTGEPVFEGNSAVAVCGHHVVTPPARPSARCDNEMSAEFEQLVLQCLAKKPDERPASAYQLAEDLSNLPESGKWTTLQAESWWAENGDDDGEFSGVQTVRESGRIQQLTVDLSKRAHGS